MSHSPEVSPKFGDQTSAGSLLLPRGPAQSRKCSSTQTSPGYSCQENIPEKAQSISHQQKLPFPGDRAHTVQVLLTETTQILGFELPIFVNSLNVCPRNNKTIQETPFTVKTIVQPSPPSSCHPLSPTTVSLWGYTGHQLSENFENTKPDFQTSDLNFNS